MSLILSPATVRSLAAHVRSDHHRSALEVLIACLEAIEEHEGRSDMRLSTLHDQVVEDGLELESEALLTLPLELVNFLAEKVAAGNYDSAASLVEFGLRLLDAEESASEQLRRAIQIGLDELDRGEGLSRDEVHARIREVRKGVRL
jgi:putative addiction module CopG family antidote